MSSETERTLAGRIAARSPSGDVTTGAAIITVTTTSATTAEQLQKDATTRKRSLSPVKERPAINKRAMPDQYGEEMYAYYQEQRTKTAKPTETDTANKEQIQVPAEDEYVVVSSDEIQKEAGEDVDEIEGFVVVPKDPGNASPQAQLFRRFAARFI